MTRWGRAARELIAATGLLAAGFVALGLDPSEARAEGALVGAASDGEKARAQDLYKSGAMSFEFRRWEEALGKFRASYAVVRSPNTHLMISRSLIELGQKLEAYNELLATEAEAKQAGERYEEAARKAAELRSTIVGTVAVLTVRVTGGEDPAITVLVGGADWPRSRWGQPLAMKPGEVEIVARYHGEERRREKVALALGASQVVALDLGASAPTGAPPPGPVPAPAPTPPPDEEEAPSSPLIPLAAISAGVGAGGLAVFTVFGLMNQSTYDTLEKRCGGGGCGPSDQDEVDEGKTQQTVANVGLIIGAVGLAAAGTLVIVELASDDEPSSSASSGAPQLRLGPGSASVAGAF